MIKERLIMAVNELTPQSAEALFTKENTIDAIPSDMKRIIIPVFGFNGAEKHMRGEWGANGPYEEEVDGFAFQNPKDGSKQVLKKNEGVLICYDAPGRKEKIDAYLKEHPEALKDTKGIAGFVDYLSKHVVNDGGKADLWDSDLSFASGLKDAPKKEDFELGKTGSYVKSKEAVQAIFVKAGTKFRGQTGSPQVADKEGAYLIKDSAGIRMIQAKEFKKAYEVTHDPKNVSNPLKLVSYKAGGR